MRETAVIVIAYAMIAIATAGYARAQSPAARVDASPERGLARRSITGTSGGSASAT